MILTFDVLRFHFKRPINQNWIIPVRDIWSFEPEESTFTFNFTFKGESDPPLSFQYSDITLYQWGTRIPTYEEIVAEIRDILAQAAVIEAQGSQYQKFFATEGQTEFIVTDFVPNGKGLVLVDDAPNTENWTLNGATYTFTAGLGLNQIVKIYQ